MSGGMKEFLAQMEAAGREAVKDVRATVHEIYSGRPEHAAEVGAPGNVLQREAYEAKHEGSQAKEIDLEM